MFGNWFNTKAANEFAIEQAQEFAKLVPSSDDDRSDVASKRLRGAQDLLFSRTKTFAERNKLNLFSRAKLSNTLQWQLIEMGYDRALVQNMVMEVTRIVTLVKPRK